MPATIVTESDRVRRDLRNVRRQAHFASTRHDTRAFGRAVRELLRLERIEDSLAEDSCECRHTDCRGSYKPDGDHELAF